MVRQEGFAALLRNAHGVRFAHPATLRVAPSRVRIHAILPQKKTPLGRSVKHILVRQEGFEPPTLGLEVPCSILLSYWRGFG